MDGVPLVVGALGVVVLCGRIPSRAAAYAYRMRCISPILIKNGQRRDYVPCGKCNFCLQNRRADWTFRLRQELKKSKSSYFLTLTYEEKNVTRNPESGLPELSKRTLQLFIKRLRKENARLVPWPLRYYAVGEYGTQTERPHYHIIIFNLSQELSKRLVDIWLLGQCHVGDVSAASIHYVTKYHVNKVGDYPGRAPPFCFYEQASRAGNSLLTYTL